MPTSSTLAAALLLATLPSAAQQKPDNTAREALIQSLDTLAARQTVTRRDTVAKIKTKREAQQRQAEVRTKMLLLLGPLPPRTPLNPQITGQVQLSGFHIEKLTYESQPGFHVTALLYLPDGIPDNPAKKLPAIVVAPGHGATGKASDYAFASLFARNGFAVLSYDPLGQGERLQYPDAANPTKTLSKGPTGEHGEAGLQPVLIGESVAKYMLWDGIRAVDYLQSRPEIDPARIGAFGCSGGGAMTALLGALDPRIAATATACYITSFDTLLPAIGPQDGEQSTPGWIAAGLDFPDWIELAAPRPYAVIATASDMFPYAGARASVTEARRFYALFDPPSAGKPTGAPDPGIPTAPTLNPDTPNAVPPTAKLQFITGIGGHGNLRPLQSQIVGFFLAHLAPNTPSSSSAPPTKSVGSPTEPQGREAPPSPTTFQVTPTGQVSTSFPGAETVFSLNRKHASALPKPPSLDPAHLKQIVRTITGATAPPGSPLKPIQPESKMPATAAWATETPPAPHLRPPHGYPAVLLLASSPIALYDGSGPGGGPEEGRMHALATEGNFTLFLNPRPSPAGTEELKSPLLGPFYLLGLRAELTGSTLLGIRIDDVIQAVDSLAANPAVDPTHITAEASGHEALVLLHAAVLDPRLKHITLTHLPPTYRELLANPIPTDAPQDILPGVLLHYDTPDLLRALGSRVSVLP